MSGMHCMNFPTCPELSDTPTAPRCSKPDCPGATNWSDIFPAVADTRRTDSSESPLPASFSAPPSSPTPAQSTAGGKFWLELREPNCVPERKGPFRTEKTAEVLREFMRERPQAMISVVTLGYDGPSFEDAPTCLMQADGRSTSTALKHIETSNAALSAAPVGEPFGFVRTTGADHLKRSGCTVVYARDHKLPDDIAVYTHPPTPAVGLEEVARQLCLSYGRDPDELTSVLEMCTADNQPVPTWEVYQEQAEWLLERYAILSLLSVKAGG